MRPNRSRLRRSIPRLTRLRPWLAPLPKRTEAERLALIEASRYLAHRSEEHTGEGHQDEALAAKNLASELMEQALGDLSPKDVGDLLLKSYSSFRVR